MPALVSISRLPPPVMPAGSSSVLHSPVVSLRASTSTKPSDRGRSAVVLFADVGFQHGFEIVAEVAFGAQSQCRRRSGACRGKRSGGTGWRTRSLVLVVVSEAENGDEFGVQRPIDGSALRLRRKRVWTVPMSSPNREFFDPSIMSMATCSALLAASRMASYNCRSTTFWSMTMTTLSKNGRAEPPDHELRRRFDRVERVQIDGKYLDSDGWRRNQEFVQLAVNPTGGTALERGAYARCSQNSVGALRASERCRGGRLPKHGSSLFYRRSLHHQKADELESGSV